jgi:site-specific recombinase XerD
MASIKVVLKNKVNTEGEKTLFLRIIKNRKAKYISLEYRIKEKDWDCVQSKVKKSNLNSAKLNIYIATKIAEAQSVALEMETGSKFIETKNIKEAILGSKSVSFIKYAEEVIEKHKLKNSIGTYHRYMSVVSKIKVYINNYELTFNDITSNYLNDYENYLRTILKNKTNTVLSNFKVIRSIVNEAIKNDIIPYDKNPFLKFQLKHEKTNIEFLTEEELIKLDHLILNPNSIKFHIRNMFVFASYAGGLRISDLITLKWSSYDGERLLVNTMKTGSTVSIKLPTRAFQIIETYKTYKSTNNDYVFPLTKKTINELNPIEIHKFVSSSSAYINYNLKELAITAGISKKIHFHISRHTWATRALRKGARIEFISKLLGHSSIRTTQIYTKIVNEDLDKTMELFD